MLSNARLELLSMKNVLPNYSNEKHIYIIAILISLLLSFWIDARESLINPDAICYLSSAESIGKHGIQGAMNLCGQARWPFYSLLIYYFVQVSQLPYSIAAYTIDSIFSFISVFFFILIVKELGGTKRILWLAAGVILFSHAFNSAREYIIRDHGFWAFYLASLYFLLNYFRKPNWFASLAFSASLLIAGLFRLEGLIFLICLPFVVWFCSQYSIKQRFKLFFTLNQLTFVSVLGLSVWVFLHKQNSLTELGRFTEIIHQFQHGLNILNERFQATKVLLTTYVLPIDAHRDAGTILFLILIAWFAISLLKNLSFGYGLTLLYAWQRKVLSFSPSAKLVLFAYIFVNVVITLVFLFERLFLSSRYLIALSLMLMLFVPFALDDLIRKCGMLKFRLLLFLIALCIFFSSLGGIFDFGYSKKYIYDAGIWISKNVPSNAFLYVNDYQLMYYSHHFVDSIFIKYQEISRLDNIVSGRWRRYDYIALRLNKKDENKIISALPDFNLIPIKKFSNKRGDYVAIYQVHS